MDLSSHGEMINFNCAFKKDDIKKTIVLLLIYVTILYLINTFGMVAGWQGNDADLGKTLRRSRASQQVTSLFLGLTTLTMVMPPEAGTLCPCHHPWQMKES